MGVSAVAINLFTQVTQRGEIPPAICTNEGTTCLLAKREVYSKYIDPKKREQSKNSPPPPPATKPTKRQTV